MKTSLKTLFIVWIFVFIIILLPGSWSKADPSTVVVLPHPGPGNTAEMFKAKGLTDDSVLFQWDNNIAVNSVPSLNNGDIETSRFITEHPCSLFALYFYLSGRGALEAHIWPVISGFPDVDVDLMTPITISGGGLGWHTIDLQEHLGHKVYIPAMTTFQAGRLCHGSGEARLKYSSNATPVCSHWYVASENLWYYIGNSSNPLPYMLRAEGVYFNKDTVKQFTNVTDDATFSSGNLLTVSIGDYDNDGFDDAAFSGVVYHNEGDGTFDSTDIDFGGPTNWGDFNGDGWLDAVATSPRTRSTPKHLSLWKNNGDGTFTDVTDSIGFADFDGPKGSTDDDKGTLKMMKISAALGDINGDNWLDLYVAGGETGGGGTYDFYYSHLYFNQGGTLFVEVTDSFAPSIYEQRPARGISFCDFDTDGDQDIYVTYYRLERNLFLINDGTGHLTDMAAEYGVVGHPDSAGEDVAYGHSTGSKWCDFDNDGDFDLICANLAHPRYIEFSDKTYILRNNGDGTFTNIFDSSGVEYYETHSCLAVGDYNNDGDIDFYMSSTYEGYHSWLYQGNGDGTFTLDNYSSGILVDDGWGAAWTDYDNDGDLDLLAAVHDGVALYRNDGCPLSNNWVKINLICDEHTNNYFAFGAQARLYLSDGRILSRCVQQSGTEGSLESRIMHFGTGHAATADSLVILWPAGEGKGLTKQVIPDFAIDKWSYTIYESGDIDSTTSIGDRAPFSLKANASLKVTPNPFKRACIIEAKGPVAIYDLSGQKVALLGSGHDGKKNTYTWHGIKDKGASLTSGLYIVRELNSGTTEKVMLLK